MGRFHGKTVIVTGSSSGIGQAIALAFGKEGANIVVHGQREEKIKETLDQLQSYGVNSDRYLVVKGPIQEDDTQDRLISETLDKFGQIDVLVNNAGIAHHPDEKDANSVKSLDYIYQVNFRSIYTLTPKIISHLSKTKGNIINISSIYSNRLSTTALPYSVMKAALDHYTKGAALQYAKDGVRINIVAPGFVPTDFRVRHGMSTDQFQETYQRACDNLVPMKRLGEADEIARTVLFLASDEASYTTGAYLNVDGGLLAGVPVEIWFK
ncbi:unnamed protein product [Bursaphelenchus okinawaensis]|uniref:Uncharacterized protein n=1 Tax=Bursaphelenchus okinawaensis TaxID=465554 RepID=A0A811KP63_9BILA|nr:unnamed protein product [Bursaphelenchus okinawaensis]CAG9107125.1 unnamed protein product [Bursaphelenchus okinawaensis]